MSLTGHRVESLRIEMLDIKDNAKGAYQFAEKSVRIESSTGAVIRSGGTLEVSDDETDWLQTRLQIYYVSNGVEYSRGVYIPATPTGSRSTRNGVRQVELYDKTLVLHEDCVASSYAVNKGVNVVNHVRSLITGAGEARHNLEDSSETTIVQTVWEPGTSKLQIVNDLLESINYTKLSASSEGLLESSPATSYESKTPVWTFDDDTYTGLYLDDFGDQQDLFAVPNRWIGMTRSDGDEPGLRVVVENTDPDSPFSIENRGRVITRVSEDVEATSFAVLDAIIRGNLTGATNASRKFTITHPWVPLELEDVVRFKNTEYSIDAMCRVSKTEENFTLPGALVTTTLWELGGFEGDDGEEE